MLGVPFKRKVSPQINSNERYFISLKVSFRSLFWWKTYSLVSFCIREITWELKINLSDLFVIIYRN